MFRIGRYELGHKIGKGSFGTVKVATDAEEGTQWAIKIILKSSLENDALMKARLAYEIRIVKLLDHPSVMPLREVMSTQHYYYLVFPLASRDLFSHIEQHRHLSEDSARRYFRQLISGVRYLHAHRVVHRDLKPENLLLDGDDRLRIADFGLATVLKLDADTGAVRPLEDHCGTPSYMAPEVVRREAYDGRAADMWACGVILFVMLTGRLPKSQDFRELLWATPNVSLPAVALMESLLHPDPCRRLTAAEAETHRWLTTTDCVERRPARKCSLAPLNLRCGR